MGDCPLLSLSRCSGVLFWVPNMAQQNQMLPYAAAPLLHCDLWGWPGPPGSQDAVMERSGLLLRHKEKFLLEKINNNNNNKSVRARRHGKFITANGDFSSAPGGSTMQQNKAHCSCCIFSSSSPTLLHFNIQIPPPHPWHWYPEPLHATYQAVQLCCNGNRCCRFTLIHPSVLSVCLLRGRALGLLCPPPTCTETGRHSAEFRA